MHPVAVVWADELAAYDFGPNHPLAPVRVELTMSLARAFGRSRPAERRRDCSRRRRRRVARARALARLHRRGSRRSRQARGSDLVRQMFPSSHGMHEASARVVGATVAAARAVHEGRALHAVNVAGGLHHAMPANASGFCVYNDPAIAIAWLLEQGVAANRLRRHRRASRRRRAGRLLRRSPRAHYLFASERADAFSGHRISRRERRTARRRIRSQRGAAAGHRRRWLAAGVPRHRPAAAAQLRSGDSWSASTDVTATGSTLLRSSRSPSTGSGPRTRRCTNLLTSSRAVAGLRPAAAAMHSPRWSRAPGPTCSRSPRAHRSTRRRRRRLGVAGRGGRAHRRPRAGVDDGRRVGDVSRFRRGPRSGRPDRPLHHGDDARDVSVARLYRRRLLMTPGVRGPRSRSPRSELLEYLSATRIAGPVATPRENESRELQADGAARSRLLVRARATGAWTFDDVLALMASRCGVSPDPLHDSGADSIDPASDRRAARGDGRPPAQRPPRRRRACLVATGHPTGLLVDPSRDRPVPRGPPAARCWHRPRGGTTSTSPAGRTSVMCGLCSGVGRQSGGQSAAHALADPDGTDAAGSCRRRRGRHPTWSWPITVLPVQRVEPASPASASPTPTIRRCSLARPRVTSRCACRSTTTSCQTCTSR